VVRDRAPHAARPAVTGRALVLGTVVVVLVVLLASPLHRYFGSRGDVNGAAQQLHSDQAALTQLQQQQAQWSDPGFIEQQARSRLQYAMPGDTVYVVVGAGQSSNLNGTSDVKNTSTQPTGSTWNTRLWGSIQAAGAAPH
jgi:cell division protein FtsB